MMLFSRSRCRRVVPHVLAAWLAAFVLTLAHACLVHGHHESGATVVAGIADRHGDSFPSDCERFCNDNTPLSAKLVQADDADPTFGGFSVVLPPAPPSLVPAAHADRPHAHAVARAPAVTVLETSQRLAL